MQPDEPIVARRSGLHLLAGFACIAVVICFFAFLKKTKRAMAEGGGKFANLAEPRRTDLERAIDSEAPDPDEKPKRTTVAKMLSIERPAELRTKSELPNKRFGPLETHVWQLDVRVISIASHEDGDFYLVLSQDGHEFVAELPNPELCRKSPFYPQIRQVRAQLTKELKPFLMPRRVDRPAQIVGLGYFGKPGTVLRKNNGARIFPLLSLRWM